LVKTVPVGKQTVVAAIFTVTGTQNRKRLGEDIAQFCGIANQLAEVASTAWNAVEQVEKGFSQGGVGLGFFADDQMQVINFAAKLAL